VLSLSQSRSSSRQRTRKAYAYDGYFIESNSEIRVAGDIPKAKSTSVLHPGVSFTDEAVGVAESNKQRHHTRKGTAPLPLRSPPIKYHTKESNHEWFHRAGLAIAGETRDSKGQGWLVRRESSTSLVGQGDEYHADGSHHHDDGRMALLSGEHVNEADYPTAFFSPRISRAGSRFPSRMGSRVPSARPSRRGSRVGSRVDIMTSLGGTKSASARHSLDMSEPDDRFIEPDFIEADEDSDGDEEEVARLARERGFGLGGWMDKLIGWTLFSVDEDREASSDSEDDDDDNNDDDVASLNRAKGIHHGKDLKLDDLTKEELKLRREVEAKRRKLEREAIIAASAVKTTSRPSTAEGGGSGADDAQRSSNEDVGGWQDAAWLLSVASKALF